MKHHANAGVKRNKKPLPNILYKIEVKQLREGTDLSLYEKYKFKDSGYIFILWKYQGNSMWFYHGLATIQDLKETLGIEQYSKFCQGKREFIQQNK